MIAVRTRLDVTEALRVASLMLASDQERVELHCPEITLIDPFPMLYLSRTADALRARGQHVSVVEWDHHSYAAHMGFFGALDPSVAKATAVPRENEHYIGIKRITIESLKSDAREARVASVQDIIERHARQMAEMLTQQTDDKPILKLLEYSFTEIQRNVYEHSGSSEMLICAQYWPSRDRVDIAVADEGQGFRASLSRNPHVRLATDRDALRVALLPGISGQQYAGAYVPMYMADNPWLNSGYGLWMTSRLCGDGGAFMVASGDALLRHTRTGEIAMKAQYQGAILGLSLKPSRLVDVQGKLLEYSRAGSLIAKKIKGAVVDASTASLLLRESRGGHAVTDQGK